uniref:Uncharacterized protein LOC110220736 isoform X4 n=1 Tax=Phascolarctos cinereus TaxID=38626 RepID=A0A6P5LTP8_PHACI|nr:uncharacterized protein LOC110220736 isoform X4 [Phascolarctos cinereus]
MGLLCMCVQLPPPPPPAGTRGGKLREKGNPGLLPFPDGGDLFVRTRERDPHIWRTSGDAAARGSAAAAAAAAAAEEEETTEHRGGWEALAGCLSPPAGGGACEDFRDS